MPIVLLFNEEESTWKNSEGLVTSWVLLSNVRDAGIAVFT